MKQDKQNQTINPKETGNKETNPTEITDTFKQYYTELYASRMSTDLSEMDDFLTLVHLLCISELIKDIHLMPNNKSPSEDIFFYLNSIKNLKICLCHI